jgi:hypothetical protein
MFTHDKESNMPLPALSNWSATSTALHKAAYVIGAIRLLRVPHQDHYLEVALTPTPNGLTTQMLPGDTEIQLDYKRGAILVQPKGAAETTISLAGHNQESLLSALLAALSGNELADIMKAVSPGEQINRLFETYENTERPFVPERKDYTDTTPLEFDPQQASDYAVALDAVFTGIARFRGRLQGTMTPMVVWPEHYDLSFLWFKGAGESESEPHMNFGFAPFSDGMDYPYLYAYCYPMKDGDATPQLPDGVRWNTDPWTGCVLPYDEIAKQADPLAFVEAACKGIFAAQLNILA